ncbi:hypothetical protein DHEL01_v212062 [Diaporthe helianthi]|uniref:2EXR domain-containing protein n=1 Tax=Diaporthe helianthi TaxID=158607 RepID=A0A2P5HH23_DIAHE|nr:hypothetical protein DHEL01_v212062 [Diaporthe helianthi]
MEGFHRLPLELREAVWKECLPDQAATEVYFYNHSDFIRPSSTTVRGDGPWRTARFKVVVDYPEILHVNHESRCFALKSGFSFQWFRTQLLRVSSEVEEHVLLPCRQYRPETDIFFLGEDFLADMLSVEDRLRSDPAGVFQSVRHLAIGSWHLTDDVAIDFWQADFLCTLPSLRLVSVVFDHYWSLEASKDVDEFKKFRHFRLAPYTHETAMICPGSEELGLDLIPELGLRVVSEFIQHLNDQLSMVEPQEDHVPWSARMDGWLFRFFAKKFVLVHG